MKRRPTITDYFIKASYSTENNDDKNKVEELPAPPGSKKNKDIPHISEVSERNSVKGKNIAFTLLSKGLGPYQPEMDLLLQPRLPPNSLGSANQPEMDKYPKEEEEEEDGTSHINGSRIQSRKGCSVLFFCRAFDLTGRVEESFTINGFNKWSKASTCLSKHERSVPHKEAMVKLAGFKHSSDEGSIATKIDKHHNTIVLKNISYLKDILETLLFCARQGIGIRGHNEQDHSLLNNRGNF